MRIASAKLDEAHHLTQIALAAKRHWGYPESWMEEWRPGLTITPEFLAAHSTFVAWNDEVRCGFYTLIRGERLRLEHLWITPASMGRGIGRALFQHARQLARELGFEQFEIVSDPHAAGFYERMGACRVGSCPSNVAGTFRELPFYLCSSGPGDVGES